MEAPSLCSEGEDVLEDDGNDVDVDDGNDGDDDDDDDGDDDRGVLACVPRITSANARAVVPTLRCF